MKHQRLRTLVPALVAGTAAIAASGIASATTEPAAAGDTASVPAAAGPADESLEPVVIGMINMDEGTPSYPDVSTGVDAAVGLINAELGGIQGRPVEVRHCNVGVDQPSNQNCAQEFANASDVNVVIHGYVFGSAYIFPILEAVGLPVLLQTPLTPADFGAANGFAYQGGNAGGTSGTAAYAAKFLDAENIVILGADNDALRAAVTTIEGLPSMEGVELSTTYISDSSADVTADVQASGAADADAVLALVNAPQCPQVAQTLVDLGIEAPVISTATCAVPATLEATPELFEGWTIVGSGLPPLLAEGASAELDYYRSVFPQYGPEESMNSFLALGGFGAMLTAWRIGNDAPETLSREDWTAGLSSFTGPYFGGRVELSCPGEHFPAVCDNEVRAFVLDDAGVMTQVEDFFDPLA
ncbi:ABC transporter substrate-binding protein [Desertimonas flava]|uniref:ABC transporter substrate-binding protein n=1 Tax=Desertimonas flava TaxID=2064846 RepID=UPI0013C43BE7|nr:ABC transporter substrate-binding protein [Desertimonas flava]